MTVTAAVAPQLMVNPRLEILGDTVWPASCA